jgi:hypothetical protein
MKDLSEGYYLPWVNLLKIFHYTLSPVWTVVIYDYYFEIELAE